MAGTLNANQIIPDQGQTLYINGIDYAANVVIGNTNTTIASFSPTGNVTVQGTITANGITSASGSLSVSGNVSATGNVSGTNVTSTGNVTANNISSSYDITATSFNGGQLGGMRNRIINGAMMIDQRNAGASVTPASSGYVTVDRWNYQLSQASKVTLQQSTIVPVGFKNSLSLTVGASANVTVGSTDYFYIQQSIEGNNVSDLGFGAAGASVVVISFWARASVSGVYGGVLCNGGVNRSYPFTYSINATNTWEQKYVTISGDTSGTWLTDNNAGMVLRFSIGMGSTYSGTAGSWAGSNYGSATGATNLISTNGATFYITGVQLEKGATATPFENRLYGTELALCQRYYWQTNSESTYAAVGSGTMNASASARVSISYPVPMRTAPTVSATSIGSFFVSQGGDLTPNSFTPYANSKGCLVDLGTTATGTLGRGVVLLFSALSTGSIQATAEL